MKTIVITKVYEIKESAKGWSDTHSMYFNKEQALENASALEKAYKQAGFNHHFRVYEHTCKDSIIYTTE